MTSQASIRWEPAYRGVRVEDLEPGECCRLLVSATVGRVGFSTPEEQRVVPMNYVADDHDVFATSGVGAPTAQTVTSAPVGTTGPLRGRRRRGWFQSGPVGPDLSPRLLMPPPVVEKLRRTIGAEAPVMVFGGNLDPARATGRLQRWVAGGDLAGDSRDRGLIHQWAMGIARQLLDDCSVPVTPEDAERPSDV